YRTYNERSMIQYLDHFQKERSLQTQQELLQDELIFGLRMTRGISISDIETKYGIKLLEKFPKIEEKVELGLLKIKDQRLYLTHYGMMLGNQVFMLFI